MLWMYGQTCNARACIGNVGWDSAVCQGPVQVKCRGCVKVAVTSHPPACHMRRNIWSMMLSMGAHTRICKLGDTGFPSKLCMASSNNVDDTQGPGFTLMFMVQMLVYNTIVASQEPVDMWAVLVVQVWAHTFHTIMMHARPRLPASPLIGMLLN